MNRVAFSSLIKRSHDGAALDGTSKILMTNIFGCIVLSRPFWVRNMLLGGPTSMKHCLVKSRYV